MTTDTLLIERREELKRRLAAGEFKTLVDVFLAWINRVLQKITRNQQFISPWYISMLLFVIILLIGTAVTILAGDVGEGERLLATLPASVVPLGLLSSYLGVVSMITGNIYIHRVFANFRDFVLDSAESIDTLDDFEDWLAAVCNRRAHLIVSMVGGILGAI